MDEPIADYEIRWWYLPSWLGLDAPCVVTTWTLAAALGVDSKVDPAAIACLFLTVWSIYLLDRLYDVWRCTEWTHTTGRMRFGRDFRWLYVACLALAIVGLAVTVSFDRISVPVMVRASSVAGGMLLYWLAYVLPPPTRRLRGKEIFVGVFFALGAFAVLGPTLLSVPLLIGTAALVAYNCLVIAAREKDSDAVTDQSSAGQWWRTIDRDLSPLGFSAAIICSLLAVPIDIGFALAIAMSFLLMIALHKQASRFSADAVRAVADFCLFTPWPWLALSFVRSL